MIIIRIIGGLGNQMFQYAAATALAHKNNTELKVDVTEFDNYHLRNFDLDKLNVNFSLASIQEIKNLKSKNSFQRFWERLVPYAVRRFYKEPFFHYDNRFSKLSSDVYIQGYFQSQKYFLSIEDKIREQFTLKEGVSERIKEFASILQSHQSVAIHVRKGDYKNAETMDVHGILPMSYYLNAIGFVQSKIPGAKFYLFSDAAASVEKELSLNSLETVSGRVTQNHFEDLYLMSCCRHNIIANSSFSWWAAWLNTHPDKIVIAPKNWFNNGPKDTQDILPQGWIQL